MVPDSATDLLFEGEGTKHTTPVISQDREMSPGVSCPEHYYRIFVILLVILVSVPLLVKKVKNRSTSFRAATPVFYSCSSNSTLVGISGDVKHPGIYPVSANTMTVGVIQMAEPVLKISKIQPEGIELLPVNNGNEYNISITSGGYAKVNQRDIPVSKKIILKIPLDINKISAAEFELIPGIGPVTSRKIVEYRHENGGIMKVSDLLMVDGIGEKKYAKLGACFK